MTELTSKKIFEEMIMLKSRIDYDNKKNKFILVQDGWVYRYEFGYNMDGWVELMQEGALEIQATIGYDAQG